MKSLTFSAVLAVLAVAVNSVKLLYCDYDMMGVEGHEVATGTVF